MTTRFAVFLLAVVYLAAFAAPYLSPYHPAVQDREHAYAAPDARHWLGTDGFGRDELSRLLAASRVSLFAAAAGAALALCLGAAFGSLAGWRGGWTDDAVGVATDLVQALPWLYLLLAVRAALPLTLPPWQSLFLLTAILGLVGWTRPARLVRGVVMSARERAYVQAARGFGASGGYLLWRHVLPSAWPVLLTQAVVLVPRFLFAEVALSFLGFGVSEPAPSWGNMLAALREIHVLTTCPWMISPAIVVLAITGLHQVVNDNLQGDMDKLHW